METPGKKAAGHRINELIQQRQSAKTTPLEEIQLSLFPDVSDRSLDTAC